MKFEILTLFPEAIEPYLNMSIVGRAKQDGFIDVHTWNIRDYAADKHRTVDDTPYGGGAGMVLKIEPIAAALDSINTRDSKLKIQKRRTIVLSARGEEFTQEKAKEFAKLDQLVMISGRYEGIDQRVADHLADEEISIGSYVLAGGEIAALAVLEATARLVPGVLGNQDSLAEESHNDLGVKEGPQYTKPEEYNGWRVPDVLLSGHHGEIEAWRQNQKRK